MIFRTGFYAGLVVAVIWGIYLARLWQAPRQVELHSVHLLAQIEEKDWKAVSKFVGQDYKDQWGHDRAMVLERFREVSRVLPNPQIEWTARSVRTAHGRGTWTARVRLTSNGEFADYITSRVNSVESPFELEWQRGATWPWDWKLVAVKNPGLELPDLPR